MSGAISNQRVETAIIKGIETAFKQYLEWSNYWLDHAPEYYVTCKIAERLAKAAGKNTITLENLASETFEDANISHPPRLSKSARFDIQLWHKRWHKEKQLPQAVIEVKHPIYVKSANRLKDVKRICVAIRHEPQHTPIKFGALAFYSASEKPKRKDDNPSQRLKRRLGELEKEIKKLAKSGKCEARVSVGPIHRLKGEAWCGCCAIIERQK